METDFENLRISNFHRPLPTHQISFESEKLCGRTDVKPTYVRYGRKYIETGFIQGSEKPVFKKTQPSGFLFLGFIGFLDFFI